MHVVIKGFWNPTFPSATDKATEVVVIAAVTGIQPLKQGGKVKGPRVGVGTSRFGNSG